MFETIPQMERRHQAEIINALEDALLLENGNQHRAAERLNISYTKLRNMVARKGVSFTRLRAGRPKKQESKPAENLPAWRWNIDGGWTNTRLDIYGVDGVFAVYPVNGGKLISGPYGSLATAIEAAEQYLIEKDAKS